MTINEILNIEQCNVEKFGNPIFAYRVRSKDGWLIRLNDNNKKTEEQYTTCVIFGVDYPFEQVEIIAEADLPSNDGELYESDINE